MDNYGYGSWGGNKSTGSRNNVDSDSYDFEISQDDYSNSPSDFHAKSASDRRSATGQSISGGFSLARRSTVEDRAREILEKNRVDSARANDSESNSYSLQRAYAELMEGLPKYEQDEDNNVTSSSQSIPHNKDASASPSESMNEESFISETDFEVGAFAAKRAKEKSQVRESMKASINDKQASSSEPMHPNVKVSATPELIKYQNKKGPAESIEGFQMSTALSSIQKSKSFGLENERKVDYSKFGSVEKSDDEIYKMLNMGEPYDSDGRGLSKFSALDKDPSLGNKGKDSSEISSNEGISQTSSKDDVGRSQATPPSYSAFANEVSGADRSRLSPLRRNTTLSPSASKEDDDYSMDDFDNTSEMSARNSPVPTKASSLSLANPHHFTNPTDRVDGSGPKAVSINSVEEIMQRWHNTPSSLATNVDAKTDFIVHSKGANIESGLSIMPAVSSDSLLLTAVL